MPEGHTLHRAARAQTRALGGHVVRASSPQGRFAAGAARIDGRVLHRVTAWGKHLFQELEDGLLVHVHLGLYGRFTSGEGEPPEPRGALRLRLTGGGHWLDLRGPTACELLDEEGRERILSRLGPDPLVASCTADALVARAGRSRTPVGALLMDQGAVAGVGNVYRAEVLFRAGVSPHRQARDVPIDVVTGIWDDTRRLMRAGVRSGRIVTTDPVDRQRRSGPARRDDAHYVYRRGGLPCRRCGTPVAAGEMVARSVWWCPSCQPW